ncbi:hypothetical protein N9L68_08820 [bacterium]|nr:hypothetical protein [bacterium]
MQSLARGASAGEALTVARKLDKEDSLAKVAKHRGSAEALEAHRQGKGADNLRSVLAQMPRLRRAVPVPVPTSSGMCFQLASVELEDRRAVMAATEQHADLGLQGNLDAAWHETQNGTAQGLPTATGSPRRQAVHGSWHLSVQRERCQASVARRSFR